MEKSAYNLEAYKAIREEIHRRVDIHFRLILAKYVLVGALLAYLITNRDQASIAVSPLLVSAAFAFLLDITILENLGWVRTCGAFIKDNIETTELSVVRWEGGAAQVDGKWNCFSARGYLMGTWIIGFLLFLGALLLEFDFANRMDWFTGFLTFYLLGYSLYLVFRQLGGKARGTVPRTASPIMENAMKGASTIQEGEVRLSRWAKVLQAMRRQAVPVLLGLTLLAANRRKR